MILPFHSKKSLMFSNSHNKITGTSLYILLHDTVRQHDVTRQHDLMLAATSARMRFVVSKTKPIVLTDLDYHN